MANNHFIPRFLTRPWEVGRRHLKFYNFRTGRIESRSSANLFAEEDVYSPELETFLNVKIENIVSSQRTKLRSGVPIASPKIYEALQLLFWLQGARIKHGRYQNGAEIEKIKELSNEQVSRLANSFNTKGKMIRINLKIGQRVFFPSSGHFPILIYRGNGQFRLGFGLAIDPKMVIAFFPTDVTDKEIDMIVSSASLMHFSIGLHPHADTVVVPPELIKFYGVNTVADQIREIRRDNQKLFQQAEKASQVRQIIDRLYGAPIGKSPYPR